jgi:hypothetical protein
VQAGLALDQASLDLTLRVRLRMPLDDVHALDNEAVLVRDDLQHAPALAAILAGDHHDVVVLPNRCIESRHINSYQLSAVSCPHRGSQLRAES